MDLKFDHIIHYVADMSRFDFPGRVLHTREGGKHTVFGTENVLSYIDLHYIEWLSVYDHEKLKKVVKHGAEKYAFPAAIVEDHFKQGFKNLCFRTSDIHAVKAELNERGVETIGPIDMQRANRRGETLNWQLLYIQDTSDTPLDVRPPFIIQWKDDDEVRTASLQQHFHPTLTMAEVYVRTRMRASVVTAWKKWFGAEVEEKTSEGTVLKLPNDTMRFVIKASEMQRYDTLVIEDSTAEAPYLVRISGANYRFIPKID